MLLGPNALSWENCLSNSCRAEETLKSEFSCYYTVLFIEVIFSQYIYICCCICIINIASYTVHVIILLTH